jgi:hypothetical protein
MMYDSSACMLRMITCGGRFSFCRRAATSIPFSLGMPTSRITTSGSFVGEPQRFNAVGGFCDDGQAWFCFKKTAKTAADDRVVVS